MPAPVLPPAEYPEHEKATQRLRVNEVTQRIGEALDHAEPNGQGYVPRLVLLARDAEPCHECGSRFWVHAPINRTLAELVGIDWEKFQDEKDAMLRAIREGSRG